MIDAIIDTGPLVGALDGDDQWHEWAAEQFAGIKRPALTCDAVISEAFYLLRGVPDAREKILALVEHGMLHVVSMLPEEAPKIRSLLGRYGKRMDYADACLVRLSEMCRQHTIVTTDAGDFRIYRRFGREALPLRMP